MFHVVVGIFLPRLLSGSPFRVAPHFVPVYGQRHQSNDVSMKATCTISSLATRLKYYYYDTRSRLARGEKYYYC